MAEKYPSDKRNDIKLCPVDQLKSGSCNIPLCNDFHLCRDYLLNNRCREFESNGKCTRSHSLFTRHNQRILDKRLKLSAEDENTFNTISRLIKNNAKTNSLGRMPSQTERSSISNDGHRFELTSKQSNGRIRDRPLMPLSTHEPSFDDQERFSRSLPRTSLTNSEYSQNVLTNSMSVSFNPNQHVIDRPRDRKSFSTARSLDIHRDEQESDHSDENNDVSLMSTKSSWLEKFPMVAIRDFFPRKKEKSPVKSPYPVYIFHRYTENDQLSYLFGPLRKYLNDRKGFQVFASGYCRLMNMDQENEIERILYGELSTKLFVDRIHFPDDEFAFLISTSAAERIFEQNQTSYSIISEPYTAKLPIEVIMETKDNHTRSKSAQSKYDSSTSDRDRSKSSSDGKLCIPTTNSTIDVISGDITQIQTDMMVCVTTSATLLGSVLNKAGPRTIAEYQQIPHSQNLVILNGGLTSARKILFISWQIEVNSLNTQKAQQSLSNLVKKCIHQASNLGMKSICFPSIGTGKIGVDPHKVCEAMIDTAMDCLNTYEMDVQFVIYPSHGNDPNQQCFQIFRTYLNNLCKQSRPTRADAMNIPIERARNTSRNVECNRISTVSRISGIKNDHHHLMGLLHGLITEQKFDLSLVQRTFLDKEDSLIDVCLDYHVLPRIDFVKRQLILRGDQDSCLQCFANLRNQTSINEYSILNKTGGKSIEMNMYVSMKIDEGLNTDQSNIRVEDDEQTVFEINLEKLTVRMNSHRQDCQLDKKKLNANSKTLRPNSWSSSSCLVQTTKISRSSFSSLGFLPNFENTMSRNEWKILRINAIENWPMYVRYSEKKIKDEIFAFHGCSFSSVQSIIHYGLHSYYNKHSENSIHITRDALSSHIQHTRRATDGKYYMFVVQLSKKHLHNDSASLSNDEAHLVLPTYLIVYEREIIL